MIVRMREDIVHALPDVAGVLADRVQGTAFLRGRKILRRKERLKHEQQILLERHGDAGEFLCGQIFGAFRDHHAFLVSHALGLAEDVFAGQQILVFRVDQREHLCIQQRVIRLRFFGILHLRQPALCNRLTGQLLYSVCRKIMYQLMKPKDRLIHFHDLRREVRIHRLCLDIADI